MIKAIKEKNEKGLAMLDILGALMFLGIVLGVYVKNSASTYKAVDKNGRYVRSLNIAQQSLESFMQVNPATLSDSDDVNDIVKEAGISYSRTIDITVNSNLSRTIDVSVSALNSSRAATVNLSHTTSLWGVN